MNYAAVLGRVVRMRRELAGQSLADMARMMNVSISGWSRVETGESIMNVRQLERAANALGVQPWQLVQQADGFVRNLASTPAPKKKGTK